MHQRFPRPGRLEWIGLTPEKKAAMRVVDTAEVRLKTGLDGDRHAASGRGSKREVTLIQAEHFAALSAFAGREVGPELTRRNLVVSGINLYAMRHGTFRVGDVVLQGTGICAPCSRMEQNLGPGGYNAMRGMGGITARVVQPGTVRVGDAVAFVEGPRPSGED